MRINYLFNALIWLPFFAAITLAWIFYVRARNKERMALIEKGADVTSIYKKTGGNDRFPWLKIGIVITGISIGVLFVILFLILFPENEVLRDAIMVLMILSGLLFGGIAMIIAHFTDRQGKK